MTPVLFLDVDGVLNCSSTKLHAPGVRSCVLQRPCSLTRFTGVVETAKVAALARAVQACGAKIVVSSTWREAFETGAAFAAAIGLVPPLVSAPDLVHRDWRTGWKPSSNRHHEIGWWLDDHRKVKRFAILDDHDICAHAPQLEKRFVRTDAETGLVNADLAAIVTLLGRADLAARDWFEETPAAAA